MIFKNTPRSFIRPGAAFLAALLLLVVAGVSFSGCLNKDPAAAAGDTVRVHYILSVDGSVYQSSYEANRTFNFTIGDGTAISGFSDAVIGMKAGDKKTVTIPPEKAYGAHNPDYVRTVPRADIEEGLGTAPVAGQQISVNSSGGFHVGIITNVTDDDVTIDFNSPLAGKTLTFEIELVDIVTEETPAV